jgi:hypothetical protein
MQTKMLIFRPNVAKGEPVTFDLPAEPTFEELSNELRHFVDMGTGEVVEHVTVLYEGKRRDMFVGEYSAQADRAANDAATEVYWAAGKARGDMPDAGWPKIYGVAVLFPERQVWF